MRKAAFLALILVSSLFLSANTYADPEQNPPQTEPSTGETTTPTEEEPTKEEPTETTTPETETQPEQPAEPEVSLSDNNNLKTISVDSYRLAKKSDKLYTLEVPLDVSSVNIKATAEDNTATVKNAGAHSLKTGENNIIIEIISESGKKNSITVSINRRSAYGLEDIELALASTSSTPVIVISRNTTIDKTALDILKQAKRTVTFEARDGKKFLYSWTIDGSAIGDNVQYFSTEIMAPAPQSYNMKQLSKDANGYYFGINNSNAFIRGTKLKVASDSSLKSGAAVNIYAYDAGQNKYVAIEADKQPSSNTIEFTLAEYDSYLITNNTLEAEEEEEDDETDGDERIESTGVAKIASDDSRKSADGTEKPSPLILVAFVGGGILIIGGIVAIIMALKKRAAKKAYRRLAAPTSVKYNKGKK